MQKEMTNRILLCGTVGSALEYSHSLYGEAFYTFKLCVPRLSENEDVIPVTISDRLLVQQPLGEGTAVSIQGQLRSYNKIIDGINRLILTAFALNVKNAEEKAANEIFLKGFVCRPTVYRTTPFNREITDVLLAVNRAYNKSDYIPCIAWGRNARFAQCLNVGEKIEAKGRIQSRDYQKLQEDGSIISRTAFEVSLSSLEICDSILEDFKLE